MTSLRVQMTTVIRTLRDEAVLHIEDTLEEAWRLGFMAGAHEGQAGLELLASAVPSKVTKQWLIDEAGRQAAALRKRISQGGEA